MSAGELKQRILLQEEVEVFANPWDSGENTKQWQDIKPIWANIEHLKGSERFAAGAIYEQEIIKIKVRYKAVKQVENTKRYRFVVDETIYNIIEMDIHYHRGYILFVCKADQM